MKIEHVRKIARSSGLQPNHRDKTALIQSIQIAEGNFDCYGSAKSRDCDQSSCCWQADCFETGANGEVTLQDTK